MYTVNLKYKSYSTNCAIEFLLSLDATKIYVTVNEYFVYARHRVLPSILDLEPEQDLMNKICRGLFVNNCCKTKHLYRHVQCKY